MAFAVTVAAIAKAAGVEKLASGLTQTTVNDWKMSINASRDPVQVEDAADMLPAWTIRAEHQQYLIIAMFDPTGGIIGGGMREDDFIAEMEAFVAPEPVA